jgi:phosphatidyl-myo-inositol alpha-mannosyltransferase
MKIIQLCPYDIDRPGGVQHHIRSLCQELLRRGHETLVIAPGPAPECPQNRVLYIGRHRQVSLSGTRFEISWAKHTELDKLEQFIESWKADIVHCHAIWVPFLPLQLFRRVRLPTIATFHDTPPDTMSGRILQIVFRQLSKWVLAWLDGAIAVSSAPMAHLRPRASGLQPIILPPAVDLCPYFAIKRSNRRAEFSLLFVGRLEPRKGIAHLLEAWRMVLSMQSIERSEKFRLTIAGAGELEDVVLRAKTTDNQIDFVRAPSDEQVRHLLGSADLLIAPSPYGESFGIVLIEALAAGVPVIAADNKGYRAVMTGVGGKALVRTNDPSDLAAAILRFADNPELLEEQSQWGREHAKQFDTTKIIPAIEELYDSALSRFRHRRQQKTIQVTGSRS